jgi:hypothetical protein
VSEKGGVSQGRNTGTPATRERFREVAGELFDLLEQAGGLDVSDVRALLQPHVVTENVLYSCGRALALAVVVSDEEVKKLGRPS